MKLCMKALLFLAATALFAGPAVADQRFYVWTYDYSTLSKDQAELEFYQTAVTKDRQVKSGSDWTQQVELEYGITDHLDAALYQVFEQPADGNFRYGGYKVRLRCRIAEKKVLPLDVLFYAEHVENVGDENEFEAKLVLARDFGRLNIAYNQIYEREYESGSRAENGYALGISYEITPWFRIGMESKGNYSDGEYSAGPTLSYSGGRIWADLGAVYGLNQKTDDREVRFLLGVPF